MTKKQFELAWQVNQNDCKTAYSYIDTVLNKFTELLLYKLKHNKDFKKYKPQLQNDFRIIKLYVSYKKGRYFNLYITIAQNLTYVVSNPNVLDKNKAVCYYNTIDFISKNDYYINEIFYKIEKIRLDCRKLSL